MRIIIISIIMSFSDSFGCINSIVYVYFWGAMFDDDSRRNA